MSYCTYADIVARSGTELAQSIVEALIADADRNIRARLKQHGIAAPAEADELTTASIALTMSRLVTRLRMDGTRPSSVTIGGISQSDSNDNIVQQHEREADSAIAAFIAGARGDGGDLDPRREDSNISERWR